jgi:hypothetical protein
VRITAAVALAACGAAPTAAPAGLHNKATSPASPAHVILTLERIGVWAECQQYGITIASDGEVTWHGDTVVDVVGDARGHIPVADLGRVIEAFDHARFFTTDRMPKFSLDCSTGRCMTYLCDGLDQPSTRVKIAHDGKTHELEYVSCGPASAALERAAALVDKITGLARWRGSRVPQC